MPEHGERAHEPARANELKTKNEHIAKLKRALGIVLSAAQYRQGDSINFGAVVVLASGKKE